jgi:hypothetical protein
MSQPLHDSVSTAALTRSTVWRDAETGVPVIRHSQNVDPILEANRRQANDYVPNRNPMGLRHIARIPNVVVLQLQQRGLLDYQGRVADERALFRFLSDPDNRWLRTDNGRRLA